MCASQTVVVLIEVHHLEAVELIRHFLDLLFLSRLLNLDSFRVPTVKEGCQPLESPDERRGKPTI